MRHLIIVLSMLFLPLPSVATDVHVGIGIVIPGSSIGVRVPAYPRFVRVPNYPVYYDPYVDLNLFFYDGLYWVFIGDDWYASDWYDGPWTRVRREYVPVFILRVPVRYYRRPPPYFRDWHHDRPPHWDEHWGHDWKERRGDWDHWDRRSIPPPAPLPSYQERYSGSRYPREPERQYSIRSEHYKYKPSDTVSQEHFQMRRSQPGPDDGRKSKDK